MKKLLLPLFLLISGFIFGQGNPYPNYQQFGSNVTLTDFKGAGRGVKGIVIGRYADTTVANNNAAANFIKYYPGAFIVVDNPRDELYQRNYNATKWISRGSVNITSFTFDNDTTAIICFGNGVCDTFQVNNFDSSIVNVVNNNFTTLNNYGGNSVIICTGTGAAQVCDTLSFDIDSISNIYFLNDSTIVACDTPQVIQVGDVFTTQQVCDTIKVPKRNLYIFQNGVQQYPPGIVEHGEPNDGFNLAGQLNHDTYMYTLYSRYSVSGVPLFREVMNVKQGRVTWEGNAIQSWAHTGIAGVNDVNFYRAYTDTLLTDSTGYVGNRIGYLDVTNAVGSRFSMAYNNVSSKQSGILYHTMDTSNTDGVTIFATQTPLTMPFWDSPVQTTWYDKRVAVFKTNQQQQNPAYGQGVFTGTPTYSLQVDANGNIIEGTVTGGNVITIINDTTINICSVIAATSSSACDTFVVNNVGTIQTVTILNDSTLLVCGTVPPCDTLHIPQTTFSQPITADNGLIMSTPTNVQLFGTVGAPATLLDSRYLTTGAFNLNISTSTAGVNPLSVIATTGIGVRGQATSGIAGKFEATSGFGVWAQSNTSVPLIVASNPATTNTVDNITTFYRQSSGTAANGIGLSISLQPQTSTGSQPIANEIISKWTNATHATRTSQYIVTGTNNAVTADLFTLSGSGETRLNKYGVGSFASGTGVYLAAFKADGTLMEYPTGGLPGGGALISADEGITANTSTNVQLGSLSNSGVPFSTTRFINTGTSTLRVRGSSSLYNFYAENTGSGFAAYIESVSGIAAQVIVTPSSTNTVLPIMNVSRATSGTAGNGIGGQIDYYLSTAGVGAANTYAGSLAGQWTIVDHPTRTSQLDFKAVYQTATNTIMSAYGSGVVGIGISSSYTATRLNVVDNTLSTVPMVRLKSNTTLASGADHALLYIEATGVNDGGATTYGGYISNTHSGAGSTNYGLYVIASSGVSTNIGIRGVAETYGVYGESSGGIGVRGTTISGVAAASFVANGSGNGLSSSTQTGLAGQFDQTASAGTNDITDLLQVRRQSSATTAAGFGARIAYYLEADNGSIFTAGHIEYSWKVAASGSRTSNAGIAVINSSSTVTSLTIGGEGFIQLRPITATEASAITPAEAMLLFVSSTNGTFTSIGLWCYENGAWSKK